MPRKRLRHFVAFTFISFFMFSLAAMDTAEAAENLGFQKAGYHYVVHHGKTYPGLPRGYATVRVRGVDHFYHGGVFYRRVPSGYVSVSAPFGAIVGTLPFGWRTVWTGQERQYYYNGVFYRRVPSGYMVVDFPAPCYPTDRPARWVRYR